MSLSIERVRVERSGAVLLGGVELSLERGAFLALVGPNGAGKTTLLKAVAGLVPLAAGRIVIEGQELARASARERAARLAWLPQHLETSDDLDVLEYVVAGRFRFDETFRHAEIEARRALSRVGLEHGVGRALSSLSGGERQRVALSALLAQRAPYALLDEPANHLDPAQQIATYQLLGNLWREGLTILCVTHDVNLLRHLGDGERVRVAGLRGGELAFTTRWTDPELPRRLSELFGVKMESVPTARGRLIIAEPAL